MSSAPRSGLLSMIDAGGCDRRQFPAETAWINHQRRNRRVLSTGKSSSARRRATAVRFEC